MIRFRVNGTPAPQGSKRVVGHTKTGRAILKEQSERLPPWREAVRAEANREIIRQEEDEGRGCGFYAAPITHDAVSVTVVFVLRRPAGHYGKASLRPSAPKYPAKRPDLDKLARAVLDGLVMGGVMADDSQVVALNAAKVYARNGEAPGAIIEVGAME